MRKTISFLIMVLMLLSLNAATAAADEYVWVLVETKYYTGHEGGYKWLDTRPESVGDDRAYATLDERQLTLIVQREPHPFSPEGTPNANVNVVITWNAPPAVIRPQDNVSIIVDRDVKSMVTGGWDGFLQNSVRYGSAANPRNLIYYTGPDGEEYNYSNIASTGTSDYSYNHLDSYTYDWSFQWFERASPAEAAISIHFSCASFQYFERYFYELQKMDEPPAVSNDVTLSNLFVDGITVGGFSTELLQYNVELPPNTTIVPVVTATTRHSEASLFITQAAGLPGTAIIEVTAEDRATVKTYQITFSVAVPDEDTDYKIMDHRDNISKNHKWTVRFSQEVNPRTIDNNIRVMDSGGNDFNILVGPNGQTVTVEPLRTEYEPGETYELIISTGIRSLSGNVPLKQGVRMMFTIESL